jgi:NADH:ubiquinone oxidoreductase subunit 5 (subunit L)/multisubunit Na+/H+ antiporter MnhA subunit
VAQTAVVTVGAVTLLFGAIIGCAKDDIKKALAASTMSQIGYMVLAAGLGPAGYAVAIMHLITHGFFKAGLFLGAGSVMHACNDETDMRRFGGLRSLLAKEGAFFVEASSADVFPGPAPDFSNHQPQSNESLSADNKGLASALDALRGDLARREAKIRELEDRCASLERDLKAAQVANESLKGSARGGK